MKSIKDVMKDSFMFKEYGEKQCDKCGNIYKLYETKRGILGACKVCADREFLQSLNLPKHDDLKQIKENGFINRFEHVSSDLETATINNYQPKHESQLQAKQFCISYIKGFDGSQSIVFSGEPGLGKSHLSYAIAKAIRGKDRKVLFIKVTDLLDQIKRTYSYDSSISDDQIFNMLNDLDLLVLDDLGSEYVKVNEHGHESWASDILFKIFDMRTSKSTICTTNYSSSELSEKYGNNGPRIVSRMMNKAKSLRLHGEDWRLKNNV